MLIFFLLSLIIRSSAILDIVDMGLIPLEENSVGVQFFVDLENNDRFEECVVRIRTHKCCLTDSEKQDCSIIQVFSGNHQIIAPRDKNTIIFVYPTLVQHDLIGFCDFLLNQKCGKKRNDRQVFTIPFDTRIKSKGHVSEILKSFNGAKKIEQCASIDEDSLNECAPVNCDQKYSESRPFYDNNISKCVKAVTCVGDPGELPNVAYVSESNICRDLSNPITTEDIMEISQGYSVTTEPDFPKQRFKLEIKSNCTTFTQNFQMIKDMITGRYFPAESFDTSDYNHCLKMGFLFIFLDIVQVCFCVLFILFLFKLIGWLKTLDYNSKWETIKEKFKKKEPYEDYKGTYRVSRVQSKVRNELLREVIVRDIPLELMSAVDVCTRMEQETKSQRRYRQKDLGSQISLQSAVSDHTSDSDDEESSRLLK